MYNKYVDEIVNVIYAENLLDSKLRFQEIGKQIFNLNGYNGLLSTINILFEIFETNNYSKSFLSYIYKIEKAWSEIFEEL